MCSQNTALGVFRTGDHKVRNDASAILIGKTVYFINGEKNCGILMWVSVSGGGGGSSNSSSSVSSSVVLVATALVYLSDNYSVQSPRKYKC